MKRSLSTVAGFLLSLPVSLWGGFLGVGNLEPVDVEGRKGVRVGEVIEESPAAKAGLRAGDVLLEIDGKDASDPEKLVKRIGKTPAGTEVTVRFLREGKPESLRVVLGGPPARPQAGIEGKQASSWEVKEWKNLPEGKATLDLPDLAGKVVYLYCFQAW